MEKIPTAEEVIAKIVKFESTTDTIECTVYSLSQLMIDFAKLHVEAALKAASESTLLYDFTKEITDSYPLENIK